MKKSLIAAAIVAAVGFSAYLGLRPDPTSTLTELQLANAEALSDTETNPDDDLGYSKACHEGGKSCHIYPNKYCHTCYGILSDGTINPDTL